MADSKYDKMLQRQSDLYDRLDNLEGCEDNPAYKAEIEEIRKELVEIHEFFATEMF